MQNAIAKLKNICLQFWSWLRQRPSHMLIAAASFVLLILGIVLLIQVVLPFLAVGVVFLLVYGENVVAFFGKNLSKNIPLDIESLDNDGICFAVAQFFFDVFSNARELLGEYVVIPKTVNNLYNPSSFRGVYNGAPILKLHLTRKRKDIAKDDCEFLREALQSLSDARLLDGYLCGYLWAMQASYAVPLLKIVSLGFTTNYLNFEILLTNTPISVQAALMSEKATLPTGGDDADPLFRN